MDMRNVVKLVKLMETHGLDEVEVEEGELHIRLKKGGTPNLPPAVAAPVIVPTPVGAPAPPNGAANGTGNGAPAAPEHAPEAKSDTVEIPSPMVGTFYRTQTPDAESFVNVGDKVGEDTVICIIEAMKVMNEIKAEVEGEIVSILVENGESVEYGQPIMTVKPSGAAS